MNSSWVRRFLGSWLGATLKANVSLLICCCSGYRIGQISQYYIGSETRTRDEIVTTDGPDEGGEDWAERDIVEESSYIGFGGIGEDGTRNCWS